MEHYKRVAVIGDVRADDVRLAALLDMLLTYKPEQIFCVGDIVDGNGSVERCVELLIKHNVTTVLGNHDLWCLQNENRGVHGATLREDLSEQAVGFLSSLPRSIEIQTPHGRALVCHGLADNNMAAVRVNDSMDNITSNLELWALYRTEEIKYILNGHSHRPGIHHFNHLCVINSGSFFRLMWRMQCWSILIAGRRNFFAAVMLTI